MRMLVFFFLVTGAFASRVKITEGPSPLSVPSGSPATLHCRTSPPSEVSWLRDGEEVGERDGIMALPDGSLFILAAMQEDAGVYQCRAGHKMSRGARLQVRFLETNFSPVERLVTVEEGAMAILPCSPPLGSPHPKLAWEKDGENVNRKLEGGSLMIERVEREDEGVYTCIASNSEGQVRDEEVTLKVTSTREVILVEAKEEEEEGLSLRLWVVAITLAVIVTLALLTITLLVCLRYRRLSLVPMETVEQVEGSTSSYDSRHGLLYSYNYPTNQSGKLLAVQQGQAPIYKARDSRYHDPGSPYHFREVFSPVQYYPSNPAVKEDYSRPFHYVVVDQGEYHAPHQVVVNQRKEEDQGIYHTPHQVS